MLVKDRDYTSEIDDFLHKLRKQKQPSAAALKERQKSDIISYKRDKEVAQQDFLEDK